METKKYTQFGTFSVALMSPLVLLFSWMLIKSGLSSSPESYIYLILDLTFIFCLLLLYKLTITIDKTHVSFKFGIGLFGRSYKISDIESCTSVTNTPLFGIGIRMLPNGWLYNVSGFKAIELQFKNRKSVVRIGTDKPDEISAFLQTIVVANGAQRFDFSVRKRRISPGWIISLLFLLIPTLLIISGSRETKVSIVNNVFAIEGIYGQKIPLNEIIQVDTISELPDIELRTNGYAFGKTLTGNFKLTDNTRVKLYIKKGFRPYILMQAKDRVPIYINFEDKAKTISLYKELTANR